MVSAVLTVSLLNVRVSDKSMQFQDISALFITLFAFSKSVPMKLY